MLTTTLDREKQWFYLSLLWVSWVGGCNSQDIDLRGAWASSHISHPSPFFNQVLPDTTPGTVTVFFDNAGRFVWTDQEGIRTTGSYSVEDRSLTLTARGEVVSLACELSGERLVLRTSDGFIFVLLDREATGITDTGIQHAPR